MRGNRQQATRYNSPSRSIPARAGEPSCYRVYFGQTTVYPRACGGTRAVWSKPWGSMGLSPRVRGNPPGRQSDCARPGSIPARAGEPGQHGPSGTVSTVYPRACGGTMPVPMQPRIAHGLSPRVRGNRQGGTSHTCPSRSIPARAGEPADARHSLFGATVYPRACGGTFTVTYREEDGAGLSPRVRGNHPALAVLAANHGSIPARAGEPREHRSPGTGWRVYPRACGGTAPRIRCRSLA